jgi:hypothetical protein
MNSNDTPAVRVTGDRRRHPAIRKLARACIELARQRLATRRKDHGGPAAPSSGTNDGQSEAAPRA